MLLMLFNKLKSHLSIISFSSLEQYFKEVIVITVLPLSKVELFEEVDNML